MILKLIEDAGTKQFKHYTWELGDKNYQNDVRFRGDCGCYCRNNAHISVHLLFVGKY